MQIKYNNTITNLYYLSNYNLPNSSITNQNRFKLKNSNFKKPFYITKQFIYIYSVKVYINYFNSNYIIKVPNTTYKNKLLKL